MVQILRDQARQYVSDQSGAIESAQNASEFKNFFGTFGKLFGAMSSVAQTAEAQNLKEKEDADTNMINTEIGAKPQTELLKWNVSRIEAGVDPNSEKYTQELYAKLDELYQPYIEQMESEKGRSFLQKQGLDTAERIRQSNIGQIAKNKKKAQAQAAFVNTAKNIGNDAREFGKLGDWEGFQEATKDDRSALIKYAKANGNPAAAEFAVDFSNIQNYLLGLSETDPETVVTMFDDKESLRKIVYNELEKTDTSLTDKQKEKAFNKLYEESGQKASGDEQLQAILPDKVLDTYTKHFVMAKKEEQLAIKERMKGLPKDSKVYKSLQSKLDEVQDQIDNPTESALSVLRADLGKTVLPAARKQIEENMLASKKAEEESVIDTYTMTLSPDKAVSFEARMALALGNQPAVEHLFNHSISDEEMHKVYNAYAEQDQNVLQNTTITFEGTQGMAKKMQDLIANQSDKKILQLKDAMEFLTELHKSGVTQDQYENAQNVLHTVVQDQVFGDMVNAVLEDNNRYFPDVPLIGYGSQDLVPAKNISDIGLPSTNLSMLDIDSVKNYLDKESLRITDTAMYMLAQVAQIPDQNVRATEMNKVSQYVNTEKTKAYDTAMKSYGLDMAKLRENKRNFGTAYTQLSTRVVVEYMGDDPYSGKPLFRQLDNYKAISEAKKRILEGLESSKTQKQEKAE